MNLIIIYRELEKNNPPSVPLPFKDNDNYYYSHLIKQDTKKLISILYQLKVPFILEHFIKNTQELSSIEDIYEKILEDHPTNKACTQYGDEIILLFSALWSKVNMNKPFIELLDFQIYNGYEILEENLEKSIEYWREAYQSLVYFITHLEFSNGTQLKNKLEHTYVFKNWFNDFCQALLNLPTDENLAFLSKFTQEITKFFSNDHDDFLEPLYLYLAQSFFYQNQMEKGDEHFESILKIRPKWDTGWLAWADNYIHTDDTSKAISILNKAIGKNEESDQLPFYIRLQYLYKKLKNDPLFEKMKIKVDDLKKKYPETDNLLLKDIMKEGKDI